jgi:hypothetical protein
MVLNFKKIYLNVFSLAILLLPVDGFPLGMVFLREFGAQAANIIIVTILPLIFIFAIKRFKFEIPYKKSAFIIEAFLFCIVLFNIIILISFNNGGKVVLGKDPITAWILQFFVFSWMLVSLYLWTFLIKRTQIFNQNYNYFLRLLCVGAFINSLFFINDFVTFARGWIPVLPALNSVKSFFTGNSLVIRASGLASEPSVWASWTLWIWPLLFFVKKNTPNLLHIICRVAVILLFILSLLSTARTFVVVALFQIGLYVVLKSKTNPKISLFIGTISIIIFLILLNTTNISTKLNSTFDAKGNESSGARLGATLCALKIFADYPLGGVGVAQFTAYYKDYIPYELVQSSSEVAYNLEGGRKFKINTYNLWARFACEVGILGLISILLLFIIIYFPLISNAFRTGETFICGIAISVTGGIMYWMMQDLFAYQPAVLSLAMALTIKKQYGMNYTDLTTSKKTSMVDKNK